MTLIETCISNIERRRRRTKKEIKDFRDHLSPFLSVLLCFDDFIYSMRDKSNVG